MENKQFYDYQVARKSSDIMSFVKGRNQNFTIEDIVTIVFETSTSHLPYKFYARAVEAFLKANKDFYHIQGTLWSYGSKPIIRPTVIATKEKTNDVIQEITYVERVKGYIKVSPKLTNLTKIRLRKHGTLDVIYDNCSYEFHWKWLYNYCYLFGNGVMDFFADAGIHPDQDITFSIKSTLIDIHASNSYQISSQSVPHAQLDQIEESLQFAKDQPLFTILYELLSCYPYGLNLKEIYQHFLEYKLVTTHDLKNILKQNECFEYDVVEDIWKLKINKISRFYQDELGNEVENDLSYAWLFGDNFQMPSGKAIDGEDASIVEDKETVKESIVESVEERVEKPNEEPIEKTKEESDTDSEIEEGTNFYIADLKKGFVSPGDLKKEIDALVIECFNKGDIQALEKHYQDAQRVYRYFQKVEQFLNKWEGKNL